MKKIKVILSFIIVLLILTVPISETSVFAAGTFFQFVNASEIEATYQNHIFNFTNSSNGTLTYSYSDQGCISTIKVPDNTSNATIPITSGRMRIEAPTTVRIVGRSSVIYSVDTPFPWPKPFPTNSSSGWTNGTRCSFYKLNIKLDDPIVNGKLASDIAGPGISNQSTSSTSSTSTGLSCGFNFNPLNWVFCGLIKLGLSVVSGINSIIYSQLNLGTCSSGGGASSAPNQIFGKCGGTNGSPISSAYHTAWDQFRNIALALLVIMTLIIIIAQAIKG